MHSSTSSSLSLSAALVVSGSDKHNQLPLTSHKKLLSHGTAELTALNIKQLYCGFFYTLILTEEGEVYVCGFVRHLLGNKCTVSLTKVDQKYFNNEEITKISSSIFVGSDHSLFLSSRGNVFASGSNAVGECGFAEQCSISNCMQVPLQHKIVDIAAGGNFSFIVTDKQKLYGFGGSTINSMTPTLISFDNGSDSLPNFAIKSISCGTHHAVFLTTEGIFAHGSFSLHDIQQPTSLTKLYPQTREWVDDVADVSCGNGFTLFLTKQGKVYFEGENKMFMLGDSFSFVVSSPVTPILPSSPLFNKKITRVASHFDHVIMLTDDNELWGFGTNTSKQLGLTVDAVSSSVHHHPNVKGPSKLVSIMNAFETNLPSVTKMSSRWKKYVILQMATGFDHTVLFGRFVDRELSENTFGMLKKNTLTDISLQLKPELVNTRQA